MSSTVPIGSRFVVAIVGGATAGSEAAGMLAARGVQCVVFEQKARPYGKIEDGLPRWHEKLREKEYELINERLSAPQVHFVPHTKIGTDVDFAALAREWGFTAVLLAHGAWRDRPLPIDGADACVGRGLLYQNPFIHWFNHYPEKTYDGPRYDIPDGSIVIGGGLASIDVVKVMQVESVRRVLAERGVDVDAVDIEHKGVEESLAEQGLSWESLGLQGATLYYRRRMEDMPLTEGSDDPARQAKAEATRRRILTKAMEKYRFRVRPLMVPEGLIVENDCLVGLRFQHTRVEKGRAVPVEGHVEDVRAPLVVSSIGSIPEPVRGIEQDGVLYRYEDRDLGKIAGYESVFGIGNVVTGTGNILASRRHSVQITTHLIEHFLGLDGHASEEQLLDLVRGPVAESTREVAAWIQSRPPLSQEQELRLMERVRERQRAVGYGGNYRDWIDSVTPDDLA